MSGKTIDERVVEMRFDNRQFERNVQTSLSTLDKLKRSLRLDGAAETFDKLERASGRCNMNGLAGAVETVRMKFSALEVIGVTALANITNSAINTGKQIVKALTIDPVKTGFQEYETQINAVQTILANTSSNGTTLEQVNAALDELNHYADMTIYNFTEMTRNIGTFTAAGVDLDTSVAAIKGIANLAAVSGSTSQQASTAMYQLSQALAAGTVKLMDWNSVVNAGMGGQVFQDALKDTARVHGIAIDQMIKDEGSFRETLSKGWLSSEILTETLQKFTGDLTRAQLIEKGYTEQQVDAILEMGRTANDAATKVKTFTQLVDTLKEAAQSGWTETWETIVGDFEEAKKLWTRISDELGGMIGASANARNELLSNALDSGWSNFLKLGIADAVGYKESILEAALQHGVAMREIVENSEKFEESLSEGWLTADILSDALEKLTVKTEGLSDSELHNLGLTREQADELVKLNQAVRDGSVDLEEYAAKIAGMSGRDNLIQSFWNIWDSFFAVPEKAGDLVGIITTIQTAFREIFPRTTSEQIYALTEGLRKLTEKFKMSGETADKLKRSFKGLFAVLDIISSFFKAGLKTGLDLLSTALGGMNFHILDVTASVGDAIVAFRDWIKEHDIFAGAMNAVASVIKLAVRLVREWVERLMSLPQVNDRIVKLQKTFSDAMRGIGNYFAGGLEQINEFMGRVESLDSISLDNIGSILQDFRDNVLGYFVTLGGRFTNFGDLLDAFKRKAVQCLDGIQNSFFNLDAIFKAMGTHIGSYFNWLTSLLGGLMKKLLDFVSMLRDEFDSHLGEILAVGIGAGLVFTAKKIGDALEILAAPFEAFTNIADGIGDVLSGFSGVLNAFAWKTKSQALINVAGAIAILVGSVALLSLLDQGKLWSAIGMLGALSVGLVAISAAMGVVSKLGNVRKISISFVSIAASLLVLVAALKKLESLDREQLWGNLGILALLTAGLSAAAIGISLAAPQLTTGAIFLLSFAASLRIMVGALKSLEDLDVSKSGGAIAAMIAAVAALAVLARSCGNLSLGSAAGIIAISVGLGILATVIQKIAGMDLSGAKNNIAAFAAIFTTFAGVMAASRLAGTHAAKAGVGILAMSAALLLIVPAIKGLGRIDPLDMERAAKTIAKLLVVFAAVTAASKFAGEHAVKAGAMLLMMSGALVILSGVMVLLSHMEPKGLVRALAAITALEAVFAGLIAVTHFAGDAKATLTMLAVSIGLMGAALGALSFIEPKRLLAATASLSLVMGAFSLMIASTHLAEKATLTIGVMTLAVGALAGILVLLSVTDTQNVLPNALGLSALLVALSGAMVIAGKAEPLSVTAMASIGVMTLVVAGLAVILGTMSYLNVDVSLKTSAALSLLLISLSGACLILSTVGATGPAAFVGIGALTALIAAVGGIMAGLGALNAYFPQTEEFLNTGLILLEKIGYGLGAFAGNIVGGLLSGITSGLPAIGQNLSAFMVNAKPFFENIKLVDAGSLAGAATMAGVILTLSGAELVNGLTAWFTGGKSLTNFGAQLKPFGEAMADYSAAVSGKIDAGAVSASANAAKTLAEFASAIPNSGGWVAAITGENSISAFANELVLFGPAFAEYAMSVKDIDADAVTASATAAKSLAEFASAIPNSGGWVAAITGENSIRAFANELVLFGPAFAEYATSVRNIDADAVTASSSAAKSLALFANTVPNKKGMLAALVGDNSLSDFALELATFGPAFAAYALSVENIKPDVVTASASAAQALAELADMLPNSGGFIGKLTGSKDMNVFGEQLVALGSSLKNYYVSLYGMTNMDKVKASANGLKALLNATKGVGDGLVLQKFSNFLKGLAETKLDDFLNEFKDAEGRIRKAGENLGKNLETGVRTSISALKKAGQDAAQGFANGIKSKQSAVSSAGKSIGNAALQSTRRALDSHSPSKEYEKIGKDADDGLANGIKKNVDTVKKAASNAVSSMTELAGLDIDKWIGKTAKAAEAETATYQNTAKAAQKSSKAAQKSSKVKTQAAKSSYESFKEYIEEERFYNRISTEEQLEQYKNVLSAYKLSAEERKQVNREIYTLENQLRSESHQAALDWIEEEKYYSRLSLSDELAAYLRLQNRYTKGSEERKKMDREVYRLQKEIADAQKKYYEDVQQVQEDASQKRLDLEQQYADKVKSINDQLAQDIQAANDEYENALKSRADTLYRSYGLFDKIADRKDVSGEELMANLEDQVKEFGDWQDTLNSLSGRGLSKELIDELQQMGPSAISEIKALNSMSDSELEKYASLWAVKHAQARDQATCELEDLRIETRDKIAELRIESARELDAYRSMWSQQMEELNESTNQKLEDLRKEFEETVGLIKKDTQAELTEMTETANSILRQAGWDETGKQIVNGLTGGVESQKNQFFTVLTEMATAGVTAVKKALGIHSPSKVFGELGNFAGLGFVNALSNYTDRSYRAGSEMANAARDGLGSSIQKIAEAVDNGINAQPIIRPVLDLTDVTRGAGEINGLLCSRRSANLAWTAGAGMSSASSSGRGNVVVQNDDVVSELRSLKGEMITMAEKMERMRIVLDTGALVGEMAGPMDNALGQRAAYKGRGI